MPNALKTLRLIWVSFLVQPVIFGVVLTMAEAEPDEALASMAPVFGALMLVELAFLAFWRWKHFGATLGYTAPDLLRVQERASAEQLKAALKGAAPKLQTVVLVGLAVAMSFNIYGFVLSFVTGNLLFFLPFAVVSLLSILAQFPSETSLGCLLNANEAKAFFEG